MSKNTALVIPAPTTDSREIMAKVAEAHKVATDADLATLLTPVLALVAESEKIETTLAEREVALSAAEADAKAAREKAATLARVRFESVRFAITAGRMAPHGTRKGKWEVTKDAMGTLLGISQVMVTKYAAKVAEDTKAAERAAKVRTVVSKDDAPKDSPLAEVIAEASKAARKGSDDDATALAEAVATKDPEKIAAATAEVVRRTEDGFDAEAAERAIATLERQVKRDMTGANAGTLRDLAIRLSVLADAISEAGKVAKAA